MRAAGYVLTGGNSSRMGRDKALLPVGATELVQQIAATVNSVVEVVTLVGHPQRYSHLPWPRLPDSRSGSGPLAGLEVALATTSAELNLVVACDMPGLKSEWLGTLLQAAAVSEALCTVTCDRKSQCHPLCGVYKKSCLPYVRRALDEGQLKLMALLQALDAEYLQTDLHLENVNTPMEWLRWRQTQLQGGQ